MNREYDVDYPSVQVHWQPGTDRVLESGLSKVTASEHYDKKAVWVRGFGLFSLIRVLTEDCIMAGDSNN